MAVTMDAAGSGEKAADAADGSSQKQRGLFEKKDNRAEDDVHESWYIYQQPGNKCVVCLGQGEERCLYCYGAGSVVIGTSAERDTKICQMCEGAGKNTCIRCEGSGVRPDWRWADDGVGKVPNKTNADVCKEMVFDLSKYQITKEKKPAASASTEDAVETDTDVDEKATKDSVTAAHK
ncbi:Protein SPA, chloroplastic [Porphyridium purpureum]|uniref:Protein SPA, chloroplastic n=1 Tax=Porphyridium purpureum TaxID=35688 RepID=A0A5J4YQL0_PORPP|nr:Protein SPA, chloroplastic [Porphyridium purpureum]|eukprot:POR1814..scf295_9